MISIKQLATFTAILLSLSASAQTDNSGDDLMKMLDDSTEKKKEYTTATFKATRVVNGHSIENVGKGVLDFRIIHRFGALNQGVKNFFGLDNASTKLSFDYGVTNWLMVGIARGTYDKEYDGYLKAKILRQTIDNKMPFSLSYMGGMYIKSADVVVPTGTKYYFSNRMAFANQLLIARKFSNNLSVQLSPTHLHYNLVDSTSYPNDVFAIGIGGRVKLNKRLAITGEYFYTIPGSNLPGYNNSLSLGLDIETGGHVFQLIFSNSIMTTERGFIGQSTGRWDKGDIHFGFNISRVFTIVKPKGFESSRNKIY